MSEGGKGMAESTRERLLGLLDANRDGFLSGEEIAQALGISRAAVWKAVNALRKEGYPIQAVTNRGYCLLTQADILSLQGVRKALGDTAQDMTIDVVQTVDSTNARIRALAQESGLTERVLIAGEQTQGRGRRGRSFFSPKDTGLYMSLLLRPSGCTMQQASRFTIMAAVAVCEAIEAISGEEAKIKWVNDIHVRGRKVCGILTEASFDIESGETAFVVLGIGVNVYPPPGGFPQELRKTAGALLDAVQHDARNRLAGEIIRRTLALCRHADFGQVARAYRARSLALGRDVMVLPEGRKAHVEDMDDACHLLVRYEDGERACLSYGEIRIQLEE